MKYNKVILAGVLAVAIGASVGCSTKERKDNTVMVPITPDTLVECRGVSGYARNNEDGVHLDGLRMSYSDCTHAGGTASYPY